MKGETIFLDVRVILMLYQLYDVLVITLLLAFSSSLSVQSKLNYHINEPHIKAMTSVPHCQLTSLMY